MRAGDPLSRLPLWGGLAILFLFAPTLGGCSTVVLDSSWRDREITIDGTVTEWEGKRATIEGKDLIVGLANDADYLYLTVTPRTEGAQMNMMRSGFTVWFDPEGGTAQTFGIRYPLGMQESGIRLGFAGEEPDRERMRQEFERTLFQLEIRGPQEDQTRHLAISEAVGIDIRAQIEDGVLSYELKIPLLQSEKHPHAVGAGPGSSIGLGFITPSVDREAMMASRGGGGMGGSGGRGRGGGRGAGGPGGRGGGRGGGMGDGGSPKDRLPSGLDVWIRTQLAIPTESGS
jgi:hypothetical protein